MSYRRDPGGDHPKYSLGFVQEYKAEQSLSAPSADLGLQSQGAERRYGTEIDASRLVPGDVVLLEEGMRVPADIRLFRAFELQADEAILTDDRSLLLKLRRKS